MPLMIDALKKAIDMGGGWRAALYLNTGEINMNCDVGNWPLADQVEMYQDIHAFLETRQEELEVKAEHSEVKFTEERARADSAEKDLERMRKAAKNDMLAKRKKMNAEGPSVVSLEDYDKERKLLARMHAETNEVVYSLLKLAMPDSKARRGSMMKQLTGNAKGLGKGTRAYPAGKRLPPPEAALSLRHAPIYTKTKKPICWDFGLHAGFPMRISHFHPCAPSIGP